MMRGEGFIDNQKCPAGCVTTAWSPRMSENMGQSSRAESGKDDLPGLRQTPSLDILLECSML